MSKRNYPYLSGKKKYKTNKLCSKCKIHAPGYTLTWQVSWFRGDDEIEQLCNDCTGIELKKEKDRQEKIRIKEYNKWVKQANSWQSMKDKLEEKYEVRYLTEYQWRINGIVDLFVVNRKYHNIKKNKRGIYNDMYSFLENELS